MDINDEMMRLFQEAADRGRERYRNRMKAQRSLERAEFEKKRKAIGIKIIRGGKASSDSGKGLIR